MLSLLQMVSGRPWAVRADLAAHVHGLVQREGIAGLRHLAELKSRVHAFDDDGGATSVNAARPRMVGSVGVITVRGVLTQHGDVLGSAETRSTAAVARDVAALAGDSRVDAIVLQIDSPGGEVVGVTEAWATIAAAAKVKPVIAIANSQMASAALHLGSAASEVWVTPSGEIGSLGVYALHEDVSKALEAQGIVLSFIVAAGSPYKVEGNPYEQLGDEARAQIQKTTDRYMEIFVRDEARGRHVSTGHVLKNFGQGRMLGPEEAVAVKMADQVGTLEQAIAHAAKIGAAGRRGRMSGARADDLVPEIVASDPEPDPEPEPDVVPPAPAQPAGPTAEQVAALARRRTL